MESKKIILHKGYNKNANPDSPMNDIGLIMLKKSLDSTYMPACLAPWLADYTGTEFQNVTDMADMSV